MSPMFITAILGLLLTVMTLGGVTPSVSQAIFSKKVEVGIGREEALMQQIIRFNAIKGTYPTDVAALVAGGFWRAADDDNGYGAGYQFTVDKDKGLIAISTTIADPERRAQYIASYRHIFKPVDVGGGVVTKTFIMPTSGSMSAPLPTSGSIPVSATAPNAATNTYWYDTSGSSAVLRVSDGVKWVAASGNPGGGGGISAPNSDNIVGDPNLLPATANVGDVRYVYDESGNVLDTMVFYNGQWIRAGASAGGVATISTAPAPFSFAPITDAFRGGYYTSENVMIKGVSSPVAIVVTTNSGWDATANEAPQCNINMVGWGNCTGTIGSGQYFQIRMRAPANGATKTAQVKLGSGAPVAFSITTIPVTDAVYSTPGTYSWTAPAGVTSVSVVAVGGGGGGGYQWSSGGGGGGGLAWKNNIPVIPGKAYTVVVGAGGTCMPNARNLGAEGGNSYFMSTTTLVAYGGGRGGPSATSAAPGYGGGWFGDGGGRGGNGAYQGSWTYAGAGAGGYSGNGADSNGTAGGNSAPAGGGGAAGGYYSSVYGTPGGGGVGLYGQGASGLANGASYGAKGGSGGGDGSSGEPYSSTTANCTIKGGAPGGGGGGSGSSGFGGGPGGPGAVRIVMGGARFPSSAEVGQAANTQAFSTGVQFTTPGSYTWIAPSNVTSVNVLAVGGGGGGGYQWSSGGGGGGGLGWRNNIPVVPGQAYTVVVGAGGQSMINATTSGSEGGTSYFSNVITVAGYGAGRGGPFSTAWSPGYGGGWYGDGGGRGGNGAYNGAYTYAGAGAGGYTGNGADSGTAAGTSAPPGGGGAAGGYYSSSYGTPGGGGVGICGEGASGVAMGASYGAGGGSGGENGMSGEPYSSTSVSKTIAGGKFGGGGGGSGSSAFSGGPGGGGVVRIIDAAGGRAFPSTNVGCTNDYWYY